MLFSYYFDKERKHVLNCGLIKRNISFKENGNIEMSFKAFIEERLDGLKIKEKTEEGRFLFENNQETSGKHDIDIIRTRFEPQKKWVLELINNKSPEDQKIVIGLIGDSINKNPLGMIVNHNSEDYKAELKGNNLGILEDTYIPPILEEELSLEGPVGSGEETSLTAVFDDDEETEWTITSEESIDEYIGYDFVDTKEVEQVNIQWGDHDKPSSIIIEYTDDLSVWHESKSFHADAGDYDPSDSLTELALDAREGHRAWRIRLIDGVSSAAFFTLATKIISIKNVSFLEEKSTPVEPPREVPLGAFFSGFMEEEDSYSYTAQDVFDGNTLEWWADSINDAFIGYNYGEMFKLDHVFVQWGDAPETFNIEYSDDNEVWHVAKSVNFLELMEEQEEVVKTSYIHIDSGLHKSWRVKQTSEAVHSSGDSPLSLRRIHFFGQNAEGEGGKVLASSYVSEDHSPYIALSPLNFNSWFYTETYKEYWEAASENITEEWLGYKFPAPVSLDTFILRDIVEILPSSLALEYSDDLENWSTYKEYSVAEYEYYQGTEENKLAIDSNEKHLAWRVRPTGNKPGENQKFRLNNLKFNIKRDVY